MLRPWRRPNWQLDHRFRRGLAALLSLGLSSITGCDALESPYVPARPANLILISIDTLRADRLGSYGYDRPTSPAIDALAKRGVRFSRAISESCWTLPSHMSLMTGLHPASHGVTRAKRALAAPIPLLAEVLRESGYRTQAITGGGMVSSTFGFGRGFEDYYEARQSRFGVAIGQAQEWIGTLSRDERYFLFLHTYATHTPYDAPPRYREMFQTRPKEDHLDPRSNNRDYNKLDLRPGQFRFLSDLYDAEVRAVDDQLAGFLSWLEARDAFADTVVVLLSDHGEQFGEHGRVGHGVSLFIETLHIPLIIVAPGVAPNVVDRPVGLIDVMPTVLDLLRVAAPASQGHSLLPLLAGGDSTVSPHAVFSELDRRRGADSDDFITLRSVLEGRHHLIAASDSAANPRVFDLLEDPAEAHPLAPGAVSRHLENLIAEHTAGLAALGGVKQATVPDAVADRLRALGYVDGEDPE